MFFFLQVTPRKIPFRKTNPAKKTGGILMGPTPTQPDPNLDLKLHNASTILHSPDWNIHWRWRTTGGHAMLEFSGKMEEIFRSNRLSQTCCTHHALWKKKWKKWGKKIPPSLFMKESWYHKMVKSCSWNSRMLIFSICQTTSWTPIIYEMFIDEFINI